MLLTKIFKFYGINLENEVGETVSNVFGEEAVATILEKKPSAIDSIQKKMNREKGKEVCNLSDNLWQPDTKDCSSQSGNYLCEQKVSNTASTNQSSDSFLSLTSIYCAQILHSDLHQPSNTPFSKKMDSIFFEEFINAINITESREETRARLSLPEQAPFPQQLTTTSVAVTNSPLGKDKLVCANSPHPHFNFQTHLYETLSQTQVDLQKASLQTLPTPKFPFSTGNNPNDFPLLPLIPSDIINKVRDMAFQLDTTQKLSASVLTLSYKTLNTAKSISMSDDNLNEKMLLMIQLIHEHDLKYMQLFNKHALDLQVLANSMHMFLSKQDLLIRKVNDLIGANVHMGSSFKQMDTGNDSPGFTAPQNASVPEYQFVPGSAASRQP